MNIKAVLLTTLTSIASILVTTAVVAADAPKLAAPIYPGAVAAIPAEGIEADAFYALTFAGGKTLDCRAQKESRGFGNMVISAEEAERTGYGPGPWCFLSRDPIDKVKTFYDESIGPMHSMQADDGAHGFAVFAERAWIKGEWGSGFGYRGVSVHALPPPRVKGQEPATAEAAQVKEMYAQITGYDDYAFYAGTKHFAGFVAGIQAHGFPAKHKPADLDALYKQYGYLESAFFQHKGPELTVADEPLHKYYDELASERAMAATMGQITAGTQYGMSTSQARSVERPDEDATVNRVMQENPELAARYLELTQRVGALVQQGKFDEADLLMDEIDELEQSNPELAALNQEEQGRQASYQKADQAHDNALQATTDDQLDQAYWGTSMEYLQAVDKEAYNTLIVIDNAFDGSEEQYSRDRKLIEPDTITRTHGPVQAGTGSAFDWGISYPQSNAGSAVPAASEQLPAEDQEDGMAEKTKGLFNKLKKLKDLN